MTTASRSAPVTIPQRWLHAIVVLAFAAALPLPIIDHHTIERDPWHQHVVFSADANWADRLTAHLHGNQGTPGHEHAPTEAPDAANGAARDSVAFSQAGGSVLSALSLADLSLLSPTWLEWSLADMRRHVSPEQAPPPGSVALPTTTPPPRPPERAFGASPVSPWPYQSADAR